MYVPLRPAPNNLFEVVAMALACVPRRACDAVTKGASWHGRRAVGAPVDTAGLVGQQLAVLAVLRRAASRPAHKPPHPHSWASQHIPNPVQSAPLPSCRHPLSQGKCIWAVVSVWCSHLCFRYERYRQGAQPRVAPPRTTPADAGSTCTCIAHASTHPAAPHGTPAHDRVGAQGPFRRAAKRRIAGEGTPGAIGGAASMRVINRGDWP